MAGEPKRRHSKSRKRVRRASIKQTLPSLITCSNCGKLTLSHILCANCGYFGLKAVTAEKVKVIKA